MNNSCLQCLVNIIPSCCSAKANGELSAKPRKLSLKAIDKCHQMELAGIYLAEFEAEAPVLLMDASQTKNKG